MPLYLVAIHHPDDYDPAATEDAAMTRDIDRLNDEMVAAGIRVFVGGLHRASGTKSLRLQPEGKVLVTECADMGDALLRAHEAAQKAKDGGIVLLSPACASFDQFRDFEHRGDEFRKAVEALPAKEAA